MMTSYIIKYFYIILNRNIYKYRITHLYYLNNYQPSV